MSKDRWNDLSMKDKSKLMRIYIQNGATNINEIIEDYNNTNYSRPENMENTLSVDSNNHTLNNEDSNYRKPYNNKFEDSNNYDIPIISNGEEEFLRWYNNTGKYLDKLRKAQTTQVSKISEHPIFSSDNAYSNDTNGISENTTPSKQSEGYIKSYEESGDNQYANGGHIFDALSDNFYHVPLDAYSQYVSNYSQPLFEEVPTYIDDTDIQPAVVVANAATPKDDKQFHRMANNFANGVRRGEYNIENVPSRFVPYVQGIVGQDGKGKGGGGDYVTKKLNEFGEKYTLPLVTSLAFGPGAAVGYMLGEGINGVINGDTRGKKSRFGDLFFDPNEHPTLNFVADMFNPGYIFGESTIPESWKLIKSKNLMSPSVQLEHLGDNKFINRAIKKELEGNIRNFRPFNNKEVRLSNLHNKFRIGKNIIKNDIKYGIDNIDNLHNDINSKLRPSSYYKDRLIKNNEVDYEKVEKYVKKVLEKLKVKNIEEVLNTPYHSTEGTTTLLQHTKDVVKSAFNNPTPKGYTKNDIIEAALLHDLGKSFTGQEHSVVTRHGQELVDRISGSKDRFFKQINENDELLFSIANHMPSENSVLTSNNNLAKALVAADVSRGKSYQDAIRDTPQLFTYAKEGITPKYYKGDDKELLRKICRLYGYKFDSKLYDENPVKYINDIMKQHHTFIRGSRVSLSSSDINIKNIKNLKKRAIERFGNDDIDNLLRIAAEETPLDNTGHAAQGFLQADRAGNYKHSSNKQGTLLRVGTKEDSPIYITLDNKKIKYYSKQEGRDIAGKKWNVTIPFDEYNPDVMPLSEWWSKQEIDLFKILSKQKYSTRSNLMNYNLPYLLQTGQSLTSKLGSNVEYTIKNAVSTERANQVVTNIKNSLSKIKDFNIKTSALEGQQSKEAYQRLLALDNNLNIIDHAIEKINSGNLNLQDLSNLDRLFKSNNRPFNFKKFWVLQNAKSLDMLKKYLIREKKRLFYDTIPDIHVYNKKKLIFRSPSEEDILKEFRALGIYPRYELPEYGTNALYSSSEGGNYFKSSTLRKITEDYTGSNSEAIIIGKKGTKKLDAVPFDPSIKTSKIIYKNGGPISNEQSSTDTTKTVKPLETLIREVVPLDSTTVNFNNLNESLIINRDRDSDTYGGLDTKYKTLFDKKDWKSLLASGAIPKSTLYFSNANINNGNILYKDLKDGGYSDKQIAALMAVSLAETAPDKNKGVTSNMGWSYTKKQYGTKYKNTVVNSGLYSFDSSKNYKDKNGKQLKEGYPLEDYEKWLKDNNYADNNLNQTNYYITEYLPKHSKTAKDAFDNVKTSVEDLAELLGKAQKSKKDSFDDIREIATILYDRMVKGNKDAESSVNNETSETDKTSKTAETKEATETNENVGIIENDILRDALYKDRLIYLSRLRNALYPIMPPLGYLTNEVINKQLKNGNWTEVE